MTESTLMADRVDPKTRDEEAELVVARVGDGRLTLVLEDGGTLTMDAAELGAICAAA